MDPVFVRLSFSHYCRKVEWALRAAGIRYKVRNVTFGDLARFEDMHPDGTVPVLAVDGERICGSAAILHWLDDVADVGLYPSKDIAAWEAWADETIGPVARRMAYRTIHQRPTGFTRKPLLWLGFRLLRPTILGVLKFYKTRRYDESDPVDFAAIMEKVTKQLGAKPYLFGDEPTAADYATAALLQPTAGIHPDAHPEMPRIRSYIERVAQPLRRGRRLRRKERSLYASWPVRAQ